MNSAHPVCMGGATMWSVLKFVMTKIYQIKVWGYIISDENKENFADFTRNELLIHNST